MTELRRRTRGLRGAAVVAGLAVVAGSATQVITTMSAPIAVRTATQNASTANYFPAPLPTNLTCTTNGIWGTRSVTLNWTAPPRPPGAAPYRYRVTWLLDNNVMKHTFETGNTTTGAFRIRDHVGIGDATAESYRIYVQTINPLDSKVVSSGSVSWTVYTPTTPSTHCSGETGFRVENQAWENQMEWAAGASGALARSGRMFISMVDVLKTGDFAEELPPVDDLSALTDVPPYVPESESSDDNDATAAPGDGAAPGDDDAAPAPSGPAAPPGEDPTDPAAGGSDPADSVPGGTAPADTSDAGAGPADSAPAESPPAEPAAPTDSPPDTAALGAGPITLGDVQARLEDVDGQPQVIVSSGGVQVCTAGVPGATAIENSDGVLTVTGTGPDRVVDTETCELS